MTIGPLAYSVIGAGDSHLPQALSTELSLLQQLNLHFQ